MKTRKSTAIFLAGLAIILWSTVATAFKLGLRFYSPYQLVLLASVCSLCVLLFLSSIRHGKALIGGIQTKREFGLTVLQALINPFLYYSALFGGYNKLPAQIAQPLNFTWPIFLSVLAVIFLREKFTSKTFPALVLSFIGVVVVSTNGSLSTSNSDTAIMGVILCLCSAVLWALYWIINIRDARLPLVKLTWSFAFSVVFILIYGRITQANVLEIKWDTVVYPVYIGLFEMSITFWIWITALEKAKNTALLSNLVYLIPVISLVIIRFVLKEDLKSTTIIGLIFIVSGVLIQSRAKAKRIRS